MSHCSFCSPKMRVTVLVFVLKHKSLLVLFSKYTSHCSCLLLQKYESLCLFSSSDIRVIARFVLPKYEALCLFSSSNIRVIARFVLQKIRVTVLFYLSRNQSLLVFFLKNKSHFSVCLFPLCCSFVYNFFLNIIKRCDHDLCFFIYVSLE